MAAQFLPIIARWIISKIACLHIWYPMIKLVTGEAPLQVPTQFDIQLFAFLEYILVYFPVFQKKTIEQYPAF